MLFATSLILFLTSLAPLSGCSSSRGDLLEFNHDALTRQYYIHLPPSYNGTPLPLILNFHGGGGSAEGHRDMTKMDATADQEEFIVVYPRGIRTDLNERKKFQRFWNIGAGPAGEYNTDPVISNVDDVGFTNALLDDIESRFSVDTERVYATGLSNGGVLTHLLACELSNRITAIASISGPFWTFPEQCTPERAIPIIHFHGTADVCAPYAGGPSECESGIAGEGRVFVSASETVEVWREKNECPSTSEVTYQNGDVVCESWSSCKDESAVVFCTVEDGGHTWPGGRGYFLPGFEIGPVTKDISANDEMWKFFQRYTLE